MSVSDARRGDPTVAEAPPPDDLGGVSPAEGFFIKRFWRGGVSLGLSFWVFYLLLSGIIGKLIAFLQDKVLLGTSYDPKLLFAVVVGGLLASLPITVWQFVGVWRSANRGRAAKRLRGQWPIWSYLAQAVVVCGAIGLCLSLVFSVGPSVRETYRMAFLGDPGIAGYGFRAMRDGTEVELVGGFKYGLTRDFLALIADKPNLRVVHLDSTGGRIGEARHFYRAIKARGLDTYVADGCYSACTMAFAAGKRRWLGPTGKLGFHAPYFPGVAGKGTAMADYEAKVFQQAGFAPDFVAHAVSTIPPALWRPTRQELIDAHVVTDVASLDTFADSGAGLNLTQQTWDTKVGKAVPSLGQLAVSRPDLFRPIAEAAFKAYQAGDSALAVGHILGAGYNRAFSLVLPTADDATLVAYARLVVDEYGALQAKSPTDCYLYGAGQTQGRNFVAEMGGDLKSRDDAMKARVVATKAPLAPPPADEAKPIMRRFFLLLGKSVSPSDLKTLGKPQTAPAGQAAYCRALIGTYVAVLKMDEASAGPVLRHLLAHK